MTLLWALILLLVMPVCSIGPGFLFARRLRLNHDERLCVSIGLSILFVYLAATLIYFLPVPWVAAWIVTVIAAVMTWTMRRELLCLVGKSHIRQQLAAFAFLICVGLLSVSILRHFSGSVWSGDWLEHYQRAIFFLDRLPVGTPFITLYALPARPPMMNLVAAYFLGHVSSPSYALFQVIFLYFNLLIFFPCVLLAGQLIPFAGRKVWLIAAVLALSPVVVENATYTWTKLLSAFYVLLALSLYLRAWRTDDPGRLILAAAMMAGGILVHYSAGPFAVVLAVHYLFTLRGRSFKLKEIGGSVLVAGLLLATWFGWSIAIYDMRTTVGSNTSVMDASQLSIVENVVKVGRNLFNTFVPRPVRSGYDGFRYEFDQPNPFGAVRDYFFLIYQGHALMALGLIGWIGAIWIARDCLGRAAFQLRRFWLFFILAGTLLAIAVTGGVEHYGLTPVVLQPLVLIGLTLLATGLGRLPRWARGTFVLFVVLDALLGILLQHRMQMHDFRLLPANQPLMAQTVPFTSGLLSMTAIWNSVLRHRLQTVYFADALVGAAPVLFMLLIASIGAAVVVVIRSVRPGGAWTLGAVALFIAGSTIILADRSLGYDSTPPDERQLVAQLASAHEAVAADPESAPAHSRLGRVHYDLRQLEPAVAELVEAFLLDPRAIEPRYLLRMLLLSHGRFLEETDAWAAELYRRNPLDAAAIRGLADQLDRHGHPIAAARRRAELGSTAGSN